MPRSSPASDAVRLAVARWVRRPLPDPRPASARVDAAVLVPLRLSPVPTTTVVLRSSRLKDHPSEVSFPGGKREPGDVDLAATALREAHEEIGLARADVELIGALSPVPVATSRFRLNPFVGLLEGRRTAWSTSREVGRAIDIPLPSLFDGSVRVRAIPIVWAGEHMLSTFFELAEDAVLFGASAYVLVELVQLLTPILGFPALEPDVVDTPPWIWTPERQGFRQSEG